ncbi:MAG: stage III sporulation protein AG [Oscillospiraceae bacterium]
MIKINKDSVGSYFTDVRKKLQKNKYLAFLLILGVVLMLIPWGGQDKADTNLSEGVNFEEFSLSEQEKKLEKILSDIEGAGKVSVMLTLKASSRQILAADEKTSEKTTEDGNESESDVQTVVISRGSGYEDTVTVNYVYPEYLGAIVVAEGAKSSTIRLKITEAVSAATGLGTDKIKVTN